MTLGRHRSHNVVLRDHVEPGEVRAAADANGWHFLAQIQRDEEKGTFYEVKWDAGDGGSVHYIIDEVVDCLYMTAWHDDLAVAKDLAAHVEATLPVWSLADMLQDCHEHVYPAGWAKALLRLGAGSPLEVDDAVLEHVRLSAEHEDAPVRRAAVWAMVYAEWPAYRDILAGMAEGDEDPQISRAAARAVELFDQGLPWNAER